MGGALLLQSKLSEVEIKKLEYFMEVGCIAI